MGSELRGVWIEREPGAGRNAPALMIRHPANPFIKRVDYPRGLFQAAAEYVRAFNQAMNLREESLAGLERQPLDKGWKANPSRKRPPDEQLFLRWLPFDPKDPRGSFEAERKQGAADAEHSGVLLAGSCDQNAKEIWLDARRLRIIFHVAKAGGSGASDVRFTGMSRDFVEQPPVELFGNVTITPRMIPPVGKEDVFAEAFPQDPSSHGGVATLKARGPSRVSAALKPAQQEVSLGMLPETGGSVALSSADLQVLNSDLVPGDTPRGAPKTVAVAKVGGKQRVTQTVARTNDFAAVSAYYHGLSFFKRMRAYGLDPATYFRCADPTVYVQYRGVLHGSDGRVRNAEVVWDSSKAPQVIDGIPGRIIVRFGLADLSLSPLNFPLGMATDVRWNWHEYGHVMLMAAVGEREFRFAHSAGDAMAAILCDPGSQLAASASWRGVTFPWAALRRRHDRRPADGWSWDGILDQGVHGYWKEQILSSTLFRLYQVLGGDAQASGAPGVLAQKVAADYVAFLVMQGILLLGAAATVPASTPDQFVSAMMDADIGTGKFLAPSIPPEAFATQPPRVGGTTHKVIRWAFEQQGLYTKKSGTNLPAIGSGEPPPVDVYVCSDLSGGYSATPANYEIVVGGTANHSVNDILVNVGNRGENPAQSVRVALWVARVNPDVPDWKKAGAWKEESYQTLNIPARNAGTAVKLQWTPSTKGTYALLVEATCDDDRSNIRAETQLPCALKGAPIAQLVNGDNNLGMVQAVVT